LEKQATEGPGRLRSKQGKGKEKASPANVTGGMLHTDVVFEKSDVDAIFTKH
jgi:hypothetical protein